jgi:uncharacterized protein
VLIALAWPNHIHHERAQAWFSAIHTRGWATCPVTESGFVRVSSNSRAIPDARGPAEAISLLRRIRSLPGHEFWIDEVSPVDPIAAEPETTTSGSERPATGNAERSDSWTPDSWTPFDHLVGFRQVTDAHLLTLAIRHGGRLATFDRGIAELVPSDPSDCVEFIP